jgi:hypothetical protein
MPRGLSIYDETIAQKRLWNPYMLGADYTCCYDALSIETVELSGSNVTKWKELNKFNLDVTPPVTSPSYNTNAFEGLSGIVHSGTTSYFDSASVITAGSTYTVLVLCKNDRTVAAIAEPFSIGNGSLTANTFEMVVDYPATDNIAFFNGAARVTLNGAQKTRPMLIGMGLNAGVAVGALDGSSVVSGSSGISTTDNLYSIGRSRPQPGAGSGYPWNGPIFCVLVMKNSISTLNYRKAEGWIAWRYNTQRYLTPDHPYKNRPPMIGD